MHEPMKVCITKVNWKFKFVEISGEYHVNEGDISFESF